MSGLIPSEGKIRVVGWEAAGRVFMEDIGLEWDLLINM